MRTCTQSVQISEKFLHFAFACGYLGLSTSSTIIYTRTVIILLVQADCAWPVLVTFNVLVYLLHCSFEQYSTCNKYLPVQLIYLLLKTLEIVPK